MNSILSILCLASCAVLALASHSHNPYREGGYYHFDSHGVPHWHAGSYRYHGGYDDSIYRHPKYVSYVSSPTTYRRYRVLDEHQHDDTHTHVKHVPTYTKTYEVPTNYRQVDHQHHHTDDRTIVEKKTYRQEITPAHHHITTHHDGHSHYKA